MRALTLKDLPPPPEGKTGWPWTEESRKLPDLMPDGSPWPKISIVTPNYNYGNFIEETIRSVLLQGYPNLEYIIMDGGSTDNSVEIIRKYEKFLAYFKSKPDKGQTRSINEGFSHATGDIFAWVNSDDYYRKDVFSHVVNQYAGCQAPGRFWLVMAVDYFTPAVNVSCVKTQNPAHTLVDWTIGEARPNQQGSFWARKIWEREGLLDESLHLEFDQEFFVRLISRGYRFTASNEIAALFRLHGAAKSTYRMFAQREHARIALKYLPKDHPAYAAENRRLLGTLAHLHMQSSRDAARPIFKRALDLPIAFYYKLRAFFAGKRINV